MKEGTVKLGSISTVSAGQAAPKERAFSETGIPFIRAGHLDILLNGKDIDDLPKINPVEAKANKLKLLPARSILFAKSGMSAMLNRVFITDKPAFFVSHLAAISCNEAKLWPAYCMYFLKWFRPSLLIKDSSYPSIGLEDINNVLVPIVPIPTQQKIAAVLDEADTLRRKDKALLAKCDQLLQAVFYDMFGDLFAPGKENTTQLLSDIGDIVSGVAKNTNAIKDDFVKVPYMRVANVQDGHISLNEIKSIFVSQQDFNKYLLKENDLLLTEGGDPDKLGRGAVWKGEISPCIHQNHIFRIRITLPDLHPTYLSYLLSSKYGKAYFLKMAKQTTGIASINMTQLKNFKVIILDFSLQRKFADIIENIEQQKSQIIQQQNYSENLFQSLMQRAFRGELVL